MRILVTGSRDWDDRRLLEAVLRRYATGMVTIVEGGARGADSLAAALAEEEGWDVETYPAHWEKYGKSAGYIRNMEMVEYGADLCVAFIKNNSKGATMCADLAEKAGIRTERFYDDPD